MNYIKLLSIVLLFGTFTLNSQSNFSIESRHGFIYYNLIQNPLNRIGYLEAYSYETDLSIFKKLIECNNFSTFIGAGYSFTRFLSSPNPNNFIFWHRANYKLGMGYKINKKIEASAFFSSYISFHKKKKIDFRKRMNTNLDLGIIINPDGRYSISLASPIAIYPAFAGFFGTKDDQGNHVNYYAKAETIGLYVGLIVRL